MNEPMSPGAFQAFLTFLVVGLSGPWMIYDVINLVRARNLDGRDPVVRDRRFGYVVGIFICALGLLGTLRYHHIL